VRTHWNPVPPDHRDYDTFAAWKVAWEAWLRAKATYLRTPAGSGRAKIVFLGTYGHTGSTRDALRAASVTWHHVNAWLRWDPCFWLLYGQVREYLRERRKEATGWPPDPEREK
jgi:hypothetical protein